MPGVFQYGQVQAAEYLKSADAKITGFAEEGPSGRLAVMFLLMFSITVTTVITRDRTPTSRDQLYAMVTIDCCVLACSISLWIYAFAEVLLRSAMVGFKEALSQLCHATSSFCVLAVVAMAFPFFIAMLELSRQTNYPQVLRYKSKEYMALASILSICIAYLGIAIYRISGVAANKLCVIGLPHETLSPILVTVIFFSLYFSVRICVPLLRNDHARMKAWGLRTAIGILISCFSTVVSFSLLVVSHGYVYHNYCTLICLSYMIVVVCMLAYLITWRPPYKQIVHLPKSPHSPRTDEESRRSDAEQGHKFVCSSCEQLCGEKQQAAIKLSEGERTQVTVRGKARTFSILDSKSVAEFMFDDTIQATPELPEARLPPRRSRTSEMMPQTLSWSSLQISTPPASNRRAHSSTEQVLPVCDATESSTDAQQTFPGRARLASPVEWYDKYIPSSSSESGSRTTMTEIRASSEAAQRPPDSEEVHLDGSALETNHERGRSVASLQSLTTSKPASPETRAQFLAAPPLRGPQRRTSSFSSP